MHLTYVENIYTIDLNYIPSEGIRCSFNPGIYKITDINKTLEYILPYNLNLSNANNDIRIKSNLKN